MSLDSSSPNDTQTPAFREMVMHVMADALEIADRPLEMSARVVEQLRELTGARTVIMLQWLHAAPDKGHRIVALHPPRRRALAESEAVDRLAILTHSLDRSVLWRPSEDTDEAAGLLNELGCGSSIATPLRMGSETIGCLLLLDLLEDQHSITQVVETLDILSTVIALVFRAAILYETQEVTIELRTRELAKVNESLKAEIKEHKRTEQERDTLIAELEAQNAELERFSYTVSHDLKSPLITINGFIGMLRRDLDDGDSQHVEKDLERISNAADKMDHLLRDLLELSRIGRLVNPSEDVPLEELVREAIELVGGQARERGVKIEVSPDLPRVFGDRIRLLEVLQNLIDNAIKYMGDQPQPRVEIGSRRDGNETVCYVRDNGIGIDPSCQHKVFGLFDQLDQRMEGSGIGLAIVKRIVEVSGGRIWVESDGIGSGSTFCFTLPLYTPSDTSATADQLTTSR